MADNYKKCNTCFEFVEDSQISYCVSCLESGQICHECIIQWKNNGNDPNICTICKDNKKKLKNLPYELNITNNRHENNVSRINSELTISNHEDISYSLKIRQILCWFLIFLSISWAFSTMSYYMIFKLKEKHLWSRFYITIACGSVFGLPLTILFRNYIRERYIPQV